MSPKLPEREKQRPELVARSVCPHCGYEMGSVNLNHHPAFRDFVRSGAEGPVDPTVALPQLLPWRGAREGCPCGAILEHVAADDTLLGTKLEDRSRPLIDGVVVRGDKLVVLGRFLDGAEVEMPQGAAVDAKGQRKARAPWKLRRARLEQSALEVELEPGKRVRRAQHLLHLDAPVLPEPGLPIVLTARGPHGATHVSVVVTKEKP